MRNIEKQRRQAATSHFISDVVRCYDSGFAPGRASGKENLRDKADRIQQAWIELAGPPPSSPPRVPASLPAGVPAET